MTASPFSWIPDPARSRLLVGLTVLFVGTSAWLMYMGRALVTPAAPHGIVSFELARDLATSRAIVEAWSDRARAVAILVQGFDYLYLLVYPIWLSLAAERVSSRLGDFWRRSGTAASWAVLASAPFDAVENYALIQQLLHEPTGLRAAVAWWCAVPKFALVAACGAFVITACGFRLGGFASRKGRPA